MVVAGELERGSQPPRGRGVGVNFYSSPDESVVWERFDWITSLRSRLLLLDLYLPLTLPAGGGGARVATLAFCARLRSSDQAGPGPLLCSGSDLDLLGMKVSKAAERALASLNFTTTSRRRYRKVRKARLAHREESPSLSSWGLPNSPTDAFPLPPWLPWTCP